MEYQCESGECIAFAELCNGIVQCEDGSDETEKRCLKNFCPEFSFRCNYGACISSSAQCDRKFDCADGSDEAPELCGYEQPIISVSTTPLPTQPPAPAIGECVIPEPPENGRIVSLADNTHEYRQGQIIEDGIPIEYKCYNKYVLIGNSTNYCFEGLWLDKTPKCKSKKLFYIIYYDSYYNFLI